MHIKVYQGTKDSKEDYLKLLDSLEDQGFSIFDIGCYDKILKLSEATLIKDVDEQLTNTYVSQEGLN
jgi:hypothetical protein